MKKTWCIDNLVKFEGRRWLVGPRTARRVSLEGEGLCLAKTDQKQTTNKQNLKFVFFARNRSSQDLERGVVRGYYLKPDFGLSWLALKSPILLRNHRLRAHAQSTQRDGNRFPEYHTLIFYYGFKTFFDLNSHTLALCGSGAVNDRRH
ncbi:hypothetical protein EVAR_99318_1 [Eumeta japonica]|uniref:Uncharacterized protein n=1 Tax=Eumeta variegata TaxID=151549 RepID=A0A4C1YZN6_EUMVA|nr:hypothetical protein EVAR_99318_1 [Eumeta japonica]